MFSRLRCVLPLAASLVCFGPSLATGAIICDPRDQGFAASCTLAVQELCDCVKDGPSELAALCSPDGPSVRVIGNPERRCGKSPCGLQNRACHFLPLYHPAFPAASGAIYTFLTPMIAWNPDHPIVSDDPGECRTAVQTLAHELWHAWELIQGTMPPGSDSCGLGYREASAVRGEVAFLAACPNGCCARTHYPVSGPGCEVKSCPISDALGLVSPTDRPLIDPEFGVCDPDVVFTIERRALWQAGFIKCEDGPLGSRSDVCWTPFAPDGERVCSEEFALSVNGGAGRSSAEIIAGKEYVDLVLDHSLTSFAERPGSSELCASAGILVQPFVRRGGASLYEVNLLSSGELISTGPQITVGSGVRSYRTTSGGLAIGPEGYETIVPVRPNEPAWSIGGAVYDHLGTDLSVSGDIWQNGYESGRNNASGHLESSFEVKPAQ